MRVLLSEGSSLTARETLTVLGAAGHRVDVLDPSSLCLARFSRYTSRVHRCPPASTDPLGYLEAVRDGIVRRGIDVLLPTHEQAWVFAAARGRLPQVGLAVADVSAFDRVQSKVAFARLADELGLPQARWTRVETAEDVAGWAFPYYLKSAFSTAGRGVRLVSDEPERNAALADLLAAGAGVLAQERAAGEYRQVQAVFAEGRLVAVHVSRQIGTGAGGSSAARESTLDDDAREHVAALGEHLGWHGGLTLDFIVGDGSRAYIECNPRTVEPGNAAAAGVDLPGIQLAVSIGRGLPPQPMVGRPGVRTHGAFALALGAAERTGRRRDVLRALRPGSVSGSREVLTPVLRDPPSVVPAAVVVLRLLVSPASASRIAQGAVESYAVPPAAVDAVR